MKIRLIVRSILAIVIVTGVSHAQQGSTFSGQGRLLIGTEGGIWRGVGGGALTLTAGEAIRVKLSHVSVSGRVTGLVAEGSLDPTAFQYPVPCEGHSNNPWSIGVSNAQLTISGTISGGTYQLQTDKRWKGSCRMFVFKLSDGSERSAKLRFQ